MGISSQWPHGGLVPKKPPAVSCVVGSWELSRHAALGQKKAGLGGLSLQRDSKGETHLRVALDFQISWNNLKLQSQMFTVQLGALHIL